MSEVEEKREDTIQQDDQGEGENDRFRRSLSDLLRAAVGLESLVAATDDHGPAEDPPLDQTDRVIGEENHREKLLDEGAGRNVGVEVPDRRAG